jgi:hypothetical protein
MQRADQAHQLAAALNMPTTHQSGQQLHQACISTPQYAHMFSNHTVSYAAKWQPFQLLSGGFCLNTVFVLAGAAVAASGSARISQHGICSPVLCSPALSSFFHSTAYRNGPHCVAGLFQLLPCWHQTAPQTLAILSAFHSTANRNGPHCIAGLLGPTTAWL